MDFTNSQDFSYAIWVIIGVGVVLIGLLATKLFQGSDHTVIGESKETSNRKGQKRGSKKKKKKSKVPMNSPGGSPRNSLLSDSSMAGTEGDRESLQGELESSSQRLFDIFLTVMAEGVSLTKHGEDSSMKVTLYMDYKKKTLFYKPFSGWTPRKKAIPLSELEMVMRGKRTETFLAKRLRDIDFKTCLSLVLRSGVEVNLEANSEMERDALARGFEMLMKKEEEEEGELKV